MVSILTCIKILRYFDMLYKCYRVRTGWRGDRVRNCILTISPLQYGIGYFLLLSLTQPWKNHKICIIHTFLWKFLLTKWFFSIFLWSSQQYIISHFHFQLSFEKWGVTDGIRLTIVLLLEYGLVLYWPVVSGNMYGFFFISLHYTDFSFLLRLYSIFTYIVLSLYGHFIHHP